MTTEWRPAVKARTFHGATIQTIRASIANETGHDVTVGGRTLRVLPDGVTTSRKRSCIITDALAQAERLLCGSGEPPSEHDQLTITILLGRLLFAGATNLWLDGQPLTPRPAVPAIDLRITATGDGQGFEIRRLAGGT